MSRKPILHPVYRMIKKSLDQSYRGINKLCMKFFISITFDIHLTTFKLSDYNSKCFKENIFFSIIKSNCSNGNRGDNGNWVYSPRLCLNEFRERLALLKYT
jgi:hypothetical protein